MKKYTITFNEDQMEFLRQLMQSDIAVTIKAAKLAASVQEIVLQTQPDTVPDTLHPDAIHELG